MATLELNKIGNTLSTASPLGVATTPKALTTQNTAPTQQINLTPKPDNTNYAGILAGAQQQALSLQQQINAIQPTDTKNPNTSSQSTSNPTTGGTDIKSYIDSIIGVEQPSATQAYQQGLTNSPELAQQKADLQAKAQVTTEAQGRLNNISAQLQALSAEATAVPIQVQSEFSGTGATRGGVAPIQTARLRDIALKALPLQSEAAVVQAQVANAAGQQALAQDLYKQAEDKFNQFFQLQMEDANRKYELKTNLVNRVYQFSDAKEQRQLALIKDQADKDYQTQRDTIAFKRDKEIASLKAKSAGGGVLSSLPVSIQGKVISAANNFGSSDIVKKFNSVVDSINVVNGISSGSTNPADHQAIVYAFAKALDPDSAVREGEYATIKKYAQSAANRYGKEISNAINGTGFLSAGAIKNIQTTMNNLYTSRKPQYDNAYSERARTLNNIAGADVADELLTDYSKNVSQPQVNEQEDIYNSVVSPTAESSSWITNLWNNLF